MKGCNSSNKTSTKLYITNILPLLVYCIWGTLYFALLFSGNYVTFLRPSFWIILAVALFITILFIISYYFRDFSKEDHGPEMLTWLQGLILLLPIAYLLPVSQENLGDHALSKKNVNVISQRSNTRNRLQSHKRKKEYKLIEERTKDGSIKYRKASLSRISHSYIPFRHKYVETIGMITQNKKMRIPKEYALLYRFKITCCAADARPIGLIVKKNNEFPSDIKNESWVKIWGEFKIEKIKDINARIIIPHVVKKIKAPRKNQRYLYY